MLKKEVCRFLVLVLFLVSVPLTTIGFTEDVQAAGAVNVLLWQLGKADQSAAEFKAFGTGAEAVQVPGDWSVRSDWSFFPQGLKADRNKELSISYTLASVPANGVELSFKVLDAYKITPQMAVFSNNVMAGLIQIAGVGGTSSAYPYQKTYRLYIPKELLQKGTNVLKLQAARDLYASSAGDAYLWWTWDYVALSSLGAPATEPIHGRYTRLGTNIMQDDFYYNDNATTHLPYLLKWLGIAYSGNTNRFALWSDLGTQPEALNYVQTLARYNMQAAADYLHTGTATVDGNGQLDAASKAGLTSFFQTYGKWVQYYEIDNEPGLFNRSKAVNLAVAQFVQAIKPSHVRTVAPGWAYWPEGGDPSGWEHDPASRKQIEDYTDLTSGHSYGVSNVDDQGGSFTENLRTYKGAVDGLPKEMLVTETGSQDAHTDFPFVGSLQPHASVFDRILRAHIGYADQTIQHAAFFYESYSLFQGGFNWSMHDPATTAAFPGVNGEDTRLKSYRRLALAYATHGAPLSYTYTNKAAIEGKKVYFRAVDTATLAPLPGSGATADKVLLNFVNFEPTAQTMSVRVTMPSSGVYEGERIGQGGTYAAAKSIVSGLNAEPSVDLSVTLGAGESVQYILSRQSTVAVTSAPAKLWLSMEADKPQLSWSELDGAVTYTVKRATGTGSYTTLASGLTGTSYIDFTAQSATAYTYVVSATNAKGTGGDSPPVQTAVSYAPMIEAEDALLGGGASVSNDGAASGGKKVGNLHYGGSFVSADFDGGSGGAATLKVLYAKGDAGITTKSLFINGVDVDTVSFVNTGGWGKYKEMVMPITLRKGVNTVTIKQDGGDTGGADLDMLTVLANLAGDDDGAKAPEATPTASATPAASPTASATPAASPTASATPTATPTASATPTARPSATPASSTPAADTVAPSLPGNLKVTATGETTVQLGWTVASDQTGVVYYDLYRDNALINSVPGATLTYTDSGLTANTAYRYAVKARDAAGNTSQPATVDVTTRAVVMLPPTTQVLYHFGRTGAGDWTAVEGVWSIGSGGDYAVKPGDDNRSLITNAVFSNGGAVFDLTVDAGASGGMMFRVNPAGTDGNAWNGYYAGITRTGGVVLTRIKDGTVTELGSATAATSGWYHMKLEAVGDQIKVYVGNMSTPLITATDKTYATGGMGLRTVNGGGAFNNYNAYPLQ